MLPSASRPVLLTFGLLACVGMTEGRGFAFSRGGNAVSTVTVTPTSMPLLKGEVGTATCVPKNKFQAALADTCTWTSSNALVASVAANGTQGAKVTALKAGTASITAAAGGKTSAPISVTVTDTTTPPAPPPATGTTYFLSDGESGVLVPPWSDWGIVASGDALPPTTTSAKVHSGSRALKYEIPPGTQATNKSQTLAGGPQTPMGSAGKFNTGYYSFWAYIDAGYTQNWNMLLGWMTGESGAPDPIMHIGLEVYGGQLQLVLYPKNCTDNLVPSYTCPTVAGYVYDHGEYHMTASSPAGIVAFPKGQWVHVAAYYKMARTNGQVTLWQDGTKIMDVTAPVMNTEDGFWKYNNTANNLIIQFGIYGPGMTETRRLYVDDFKVTDYRTSPTVP